MKQQYTEQLNDRLMDCLDVMLEWIDKLTKPNASEYLDFAAILIWYYSHKEQTDNQPVVCDLDDFKHVVKLIANAKIGTKLTTIFTERKRDEKYIENMSEFICNDGTKIMQPNSTYGHVTMLHLERTPDGITAVNVDSLYSAHELDAIMLLILKEHKLETGKDLKLKFYFHETVNDMDNKKTYALQNDSTSCYLYATKHARTFIKNRIDINKCKTYMLSNDAQYPSIYGTGFELPPPLLLLMQSNKYRNYVVNKHGSDSIVNHDNGKTMQQVFDKYKNPTDYIQKLRNQWTKIVVACLMKHKYNSTILKEMRNKFAAHSLTAEILEERNLNNQRHKTPKNAPHNNGLIPTTKEIAAVTWYQQLSVQPTRNLRVRKITEDGLDGINSVVNRIWPEPRKAKL